MTIEKLNSQVEEMRGKPGGWPADMKYLAKEEANNVIVSITDTGKATNNIWKIIDPWGIAFFDNVRNHTVKPLELVFSLRNPASKSASYKYEALKRRVSYLAAINPFKISLELDGLTEQLYSLEELKNRPDTEVVRNDFKERGHDDTVGRLEKDFQAYLFGKGKEKDANNKIVRTNERLALFGKDFVGIGKKKYKVEREFPTGVFDNKVEEKNRILSTEYVDLVTINRHGQLALIELKFDDSPLEVISQVLNYALFFQAYRSQLAPLLVDRIDEKAGESKLVTYLVSNIFHARFDDVWKYCINGELELNKVVMGYMS